MPRPLAYLLIALCLGAGPLPRTAAERDAFFLERDGPWRKSLRDWAVGKRDEAVAGMRKALAAAERAVGHGFESLHVRERLAVMLEARGEWADAAAERAAAWRTAELMYGPGSWQAVSARVRAGRLRDMAALGPEALARAVRAEGKFAQAAALILGNKFREALRPAGEALTELEAVLGRGHSRVGDALLNLSHAHLGAGDYRAALPHARRGAEIARETHGAGHPHHADALNLIAQLLRQMGDLDGAAPLLTRAVAIQRAVTARYAPAYARSLSNLAVLHDERGDRRAANPLHREAAATAREWLQARDPARAGALTGLANHLERLGDTRAALPLLKEALEIHQAGEGRAGLMALQARKYLAEALGRLGGRRAGRATLEEAVRDCKAAHGERHPMYARLLQSLALAVAADDGPAALALHEKALGIIAAAHGERSPALCGALLEIADLRRGLGDTAGARAAASRAVRVAREGLGEWHPAHGAAIKSLAHVELAAGEPAEARRLLDAALEIAARGLRRDAAVQSERLQLSAAEAHRGLLGLRLSLDDGGAYENALAWKGAVLSRERQRRLYARLSGGPETRAAAEKLQQTTRMLAALAQDPEARRERFEALVAEQEALQAELSRLSADARAGEAQATPKGIGEALPDGVALVDYYTFIHRGVVDREGRPKAVPHLTAFVVRRGRPAARVDLGPLAATEELAREWRALLARGRQGGEAGRDLRRRIWAPVEGHLGGARVVLLSPDGPLAAVPFAALPGRKEGSYLLEELTLASVPVPQALAGAGGPAPGRHGPSLLAVGDVDYNEARAPAARAALIGGRGAPAATRRAWERLPATFTEVAAVSKSFAGLFEGGTVTDLSKGRATKAAVREALPRVRYAHLATHGFFAPEDAAGEWHPLLMAGIALAGANRTPGEGEEDGILTALEVSEMDLTRLELAVLSACETGLGKESKGEGLLSLQRAFQAAGARSVVASLWSVDDRATQSLMSDFYRVAWDPEKIVSRAEALRQAQLSMLRDGVRRGSVKELVAEKGTRRVPPFYWAGFVLSGDWR